ncbi:MAG: saccharopine dehydrogenase, partial [Pseudodonghicola sp.]
MTHLWVRAEQRPNEERVGLTPEGAAALIAKGIAVTVEESSVRAIPIDGYRAAGCTIAAENSWPQAPRDAVIFGLKELPDDGSALPHRHIMFGHAFKGQHSGKELLRRFKAGGGTLYDLEYLVDEAGRRVAAFGYWAGYAGAAVTLKAWAAQQRGGICGPV